jgi:hypothetical protein
MNFTKFIFKFLGGEITVYAMNKEQAEILAKAEAIKRGWNYTILN